MSDLIAPWTTGPTWVRIAPIAGGVCAVAMVGWIVARGWWHTRKTRVRVGRGPRGRIRGYLYSIACESFGVKPPKGDPVMIAQHARSMIEVHRWTHMVRPTTMWRARRRATGALLRPGTVWVAVRLAVALARPSAWRATIPSAFTIAHPPTMPTDAGAPQRRKFESLVRDNVPVPAAHGWQFAWPQGAHYVRGVLEPSRPDDEARAAMVVAEALGGDADAVDVSRDDVGVASAAAAIPTGFAVTRPDERLRVQALVDARLPSPRGAWRHVWAPRDDRYQITAAAALPRTVPWPTGRVDDIAAAAAAGRYVWGMTHDGRPVSWEPGGGAEQVHGIIAGASGAGKSSAARAVLVAWLLGGGDLIILDPKGDGDWVWAHDLPGVTVIYDAGEMAAVLEKVAGIAAQRAQRMRRAEEAILAGRGGGRPRMRPILVYSDELALLFVRNPAGGTRAAAENAARDAAAFWFGRLAAAGRSSHVHVLGATQRPSREVLHGTTKTNMPWRVALGRMDGVAARIVLSNRMPDAGGDFDLDGHAEHGGRPGHGWCGIVGGALTEVQGLWIDRDGCYRLRPALEAAHARWDTPNTHRAPRGAPAGDGDAPTVEVVDVERDPDGGPRDPVAALPSGRRARRGGGRRGFRDMW